MAARLSHRAIVVLALVSIACLSSCLNARGESARLESPSAPAWLDDVRLALDELPRRHADLYALMPKDEYGRRADALLSYAAEPGRSREEALVGLMGLVAALGDGHTALRPSGGAFDSAILPLSLYKFEEGYIVLACPKEEPGLLGARVVSVCGVPMAEVEAAVASLVSHDNDMVVAGAAPSYLVQPFVLEALGLAAPGSASFEFGFELTDGVCRAVALEPVAVSQVQGALVAFKPRAGVLNELSPGALSYWFARVPGTDLLYLAYNACREDAGRPLKAFAESLAAELDQGSYDAVLVDLRYNGGGSSMLFWPVERALAERSAAVMGEGGLDIYVAIGRRTFSSAVLNAIELRSGQRSGGVEAGEAVFVGEPSGGKPNHYGEVRSLKLGALGCDLIYSTKRFVMWPGDESDALYPDLAAPLSFADYAAGRDPVLEAVLAAGLGAE